MITEFLFRQLPLTLTLINADGPALLAGDKGFERAALII
jgi:hypothetical protein